MTRGHTARFSGIPAFGRAVQVGGRVGAVVEVDGAWAVVEFYGPGCADEPSRVRCRLSVLRFL